MRAAWPGPERPFIVDTEARITAENAAYVAGLVRELGAEEVVVVTSWWHRLRAALLFRSLLGDRPVRVAVVGVERPWSVRLILRELAVLRARSVPASPGAQLAAAAAEEAAQACHEVVGGHPTSRHRLLVHGSLLELGRRRRDLDAAGPDAGDLLGGNVAVGAQHARGGRRGR